MIQLSWLCFSDSGYYYDDKKDAKKLDSGYYQYVYMKKNIYIMGIFNFNFKPTLFKELRDEVNDNKNRGNTALKSHYQ